MMAGGGRRRGGTSRGNGDSSQALALVWPTAAAPLCFCGLGVVREARGHGHEGSKDIKKATKHTQDDSFSIIGVVIGQQAKKNMCDVTPKQAQGLFARAGGSLINTHSTHYSPRQATAT